jgi:galactitol-specific phosphotransferase system IIB component
VILPRLAEKALSELDIQGSVEAVSVGELGSKAPAQLILATDDVETSLPAGPSQVVVIKTVTDLTEIREALANALG